MSTIDPSQNPYEYRPQREQIKKTTGSDQSPRVKETARKQIKKTQTDTQKKLIKSEPTRTAAPSPSNAQNLTKNRYEISVVKDFREELNQLGKFISALERSSKNG